MAEYLNNTPRFTPLNTFHESCQHWIYFFDSVLVIFFSQVSSVQTPDVGPSLPRDSYVRLLVFSFHPKISSYSS